MCGWSLSPRGMSACSATFLHSANLSAFSCKHQTFTQVKQSCANIKSASCVKAITQGSSNVNGHMLRQTKWALTGLCILSRIKVTWQYRRLDVTCKILNSIHHAPLQTYTSTIIIVPAALAHSFFNSLKQRHRAIIAD